jgi:hypothetical protein
LMLRLLFLLLSPNQKDETIHCDDKAHYVYRIGEILDRQCGISQRSNDNK